MYTSCIACPSSPCLFPFDCSSTSTVAALVQYSYCCFIKTCKINAGWSVFKIQMNIFVINLYCTKCIPPTQVKTKYLVSPVPFISHKPKLNTFLFAVPFYWIKYEALHLYQPLDCNLNLYIFICLMTLYPIFYSLTTLSCILMPICNGVFLPKTPIHHTDSHTNS